MGLKIYVPKKYLQCFHFQIYLNITPLKGNNHLNY